ncbi:MAG: vWA domain-containing protein [Acetobacteraceae bacterium]
MSPQVGVLDRDALAGAIASDPDAGVALLVDLARATDRDLRRQARALAAELVLPLARLGNRPSASGAARLVPARTGGVDLDVDATVEVLARTPPAVGGAPAPRATDPTSAPPAAAPTSWSPPGRRRAASADDLRWRAWRRPGRAYVLVIDASGSVVGPPLRSAVVTAAALAERVGRHDQLAVVAFWSRSVLLRPVASGEPPASVIPRLLALRGGDTTDLAGGLRLALAQASSASAPAREVLVLTDGMANAGDDPVMAAAAAPTAGARVHVLSLSSDGEAVAACEAIAAAGEGHHAPVVRPSLAPAALAEVLG